MSVNERKTIESKQNRPIRRRAVARSTIYRPSSPHLRSVASSLAAVLLGPTAKRNITHEIKINRFCHHEVCSLDRSRWIRSIVRYGVRLQLEGQNESSCRMGSSRSCTQVLWKTPYYTGFFASAPLQSHSIRAIMHLVETEGMGLGIVHA
jgi:hypothetical protein